jgi:hypothetical protein
VYLLFEINWSFRSVIACDKREAFAQRDEIGLSRDDAAFSSRAPDAAQQRVLGAGVHSTLHGVVFAIFCCAPAPAPL